MTKAERCALLMARHKIKMKERHDVDQSRFEEGREESPEVSSASRSTNEFAETSEDHEEIWSSEMGSTCSTRQVVRAARSIQSEL